MRKRALCTLVTIGVLLFPLSAVSIGTRLIQRVTVTRGPEALSITVADRTPYKVFQVDQREFVVAFKNARLARRSISTPLAGRIIKQVHCKDLPGDIVVLDVYTHTGLTGVNAQWSENVLVVKPVSAQKAQPEPAGPPPSAAAPPAPVVALPKVSIKMLEALDRIPVDSIDGLPEAVKQSECITHPDIRAAVSFCASGKWDESLAGLQRYIHSKTAKDCLEAAYFLRAYTVYKRRDAKGEDGNLEAASAFQEAVSYYPKSPMVPYGVLALGKVHRLLKNYGEARGFLKVISDNYSDFPGVPESLLEMARIHMETDKISLAVAVLEQLISHYPKSPFVTEARLDLGKALFEANNFQGAIEHFKAVVKSSPWMVYQSADLLVCLGNSYYQMGQFAEAGKILLQAINIFPEIPSNHTVLTRIGDIFREGKQPEKAQKIYEHVVKNFPGSDGFIISSVRIAESLKRRAEKENLFQMIIKDFPDHPLTQLAYVKLAHLFNAEGDHEKSIETIHAFVAKYPGALKKEAISVMENAYGALFRKLITADDPAGVITWYERDKAIVNRINSPDIYFMAGQGYFQGHLYEEAANLFERAGRLFDKQKRPAELFFKLGISLQESGKTDAALNALVGYTRTDPQPVHAAEANVRIGQILMDKKKYKDALVRFKAAYPHTREKSDQAAIRIREAEANKALGDPAAAARHLIQAIDLLAALPDQPDMTLCRLYRDLGETYVTVKDYLKAADAFAMAIKFTDGGHAPDLRFLLAETYEKGRAVDQAGKVYQEIIALGDPFWARLAQEKLKGIQIDKQLAPAATVNG